MSRKPLHALAMLLALAALAVGVAACGDDDSGTDAGSRTDTTAGTDQAAGTDPPEAPTTEAPTQITGGVTTLQLNGTVSRVLGLAGVTVEPAGAATRGRGSLRFPIERGELDIDAPSGRLEHRGILRFGAGGQSLDASNLIVDPDRGVATAEVAGRRIPLLALDMGAPKVPPTGDVIVWPATAGISDEVADALNDRLGVDGLRGGIPLGDLTISAERR